MEENPDYFAPVVNAASVKLKTGKHNPKAYRVLKDFWGVNVEIYADRVIKASKETDVNYPELHKTKRLVNWIHCEAHFLVEGKAWHDGTFMG